MSLPLPLAGIRVLDLSRVLAGPYCALMLADMGADVIKIENPDGGDDSRSFSVPNVDGHSIYFLSVNRNKRSVAIDLKATEGKAAFLKLVAKADVVVENFRTGVMERLGLGYETLKEHRPSLIYCAISGYGRDGPNVNVPGYDPVAQAETGLMSMIGEPDGEPMRTGPSLVDMVCGLFSANAIVSALHHTQRTGEGRFIETTLFETGLNMLVNFASAHLIAGDEPTRTGNVNQVAQPGGTFTAADGAIMITVGNNRQFERLCRQVLDAPHLSEDPRYRDNPARVRNRNALRDDLNAILGRQSREYWMSRLRAAEVPSGAVATVREALNSELVDARSVIRELSHSGLGSYRGLINPARLHDTEAVAAQGAPLLGEHTYEILRDVAGFSTEEIGTLERNGVVCSV